MSAGAPPIAPPVPPAAAVPPAGPHIIGSACTTRPAATSRASTVERRFTTLSQGGVPGPEASAGKLAGTAAAKLVADAGVRLLGDDAVYAATAEGDETWQRSQGYLPGLAIAGGTDQVLRNILGERVLGLPPEPRSDKAAPFSSRPAGGAR